MRFFAVLLAIAAATVDAFQPIIQLKHSVRNKG
jgi:hypothetical protein